MKRKTPAPITNGRQSHEGDQTSHDARGIPEHAPATGSSTEQPPGTEGNQPTAPGADSAAAGVSGAIEPHLTPLTPLTGPQPKRKIELTCAALSGLGSLQTVDSLTVRELKG